MQTNAPNKAKITRKAGKIYSCQYGYVYPLNLHTKGYVKILDSAGKYVWAEDKATLALIKV
jgi:hypothetical protein